MEKLTNAQLDEVLGTGSQQFTKFRVLTIDNGIDIVGTDATGAFLEKRWNEEEKKAERIQFAPEFNGVILASRAQVIDKGKFPKWRTEEFDATQVDYKISIFPLTDGKVTKDQNGEIKLSKMTYKELKKARQVSQPDGSMQSTYNYLIILYIGVDNEIIKLKFKGSSRGNFFDYNKAVSGLGAKIYNVMTTFSGYKEKTLGKYAIKFETILDAKGNPVSVDPEAIYGQRVLVAKSFQAYSANQINSPKTNRLEAPEQEQAPPIEDTEPDNSDIREDEIVGNDDDINISDVPLS